MILAVDAGNTNVVLGTIENGEILNVLRLHTDLNNTAEEYSITIRQLMDFYGIEVEKLDGAILSSVVPPVTRPLVSAIRRLTGKECMVVGPGMKTGMNVRLDDPGSLASDLAVGAVAAIACYGTPTIVLDMGTATSMVVVDGKGAFRGGAIMPGVTLGLQALSSGTSLLPDISVMQPKKAIGTNTVEAMRSGAVFATACMIDGMTERMESELGEPCKVIATGSLAKVITACCKREIICDSHLLLKGLWLLWDRNHREKGVERK